MSRIFYSDNGSTAVEAALKMAYQYWQNRGEPKRNEFITLDHAIQCFAIHVRGCEQPLRFNLSVRQLCANTTFSINLISL